MNKANLIEIVAEKANLRKKDAEAAVNAVFSAIEKDLAEGEKVQIAGFGSFRVKERSERIGRNPKTLEEIKIPSSKAPVFVAGKGLKDAINGWNVNMRLDKFLKVSRIIKRRTVAADACGSEYITVNGKVAKASYNVKEGDIITVSYGTRTMSFRVKQILETQSKEKAAEMYEVVEQ